MEGSGEGRAKGGERGTWFAQQLGEGWVEVEPGIYRFDADAKNETGIRMTSPPEPEPESDLLEALDPREGEPDSTRRLFGRERGAESSRTPVRALYGPARFGRTRVAGVVRRASRTEARSTVQPTPNKKNAARIANTRLPRSVPDLRLMPCRLASAGSVTRDWQREDEAGPSAFPDSAQMCRRAPRQGRGRSQGRGPRLLRPSGYVRRRPSRTGRRRPRSRWETVSRVFDRDVMPIRPAGR